LKQNVTDYNNFCLFFMKGLLYMVLKAVNVAEPEGYFDGMFIVTRAPGEGWAGMAADGATRLKEYQKLL
jgi:hypothetical protein